MLLYTPYNLLHIVSLDNITRYYPHLTVIVNKSKWNQRKIKEILCFKYWKDGCAVCLVNALFSFAFLSFGKNKALDEGGCCLKALYNNSKRLKNGENFLTLLLLVLKVCLPYLKLLKIEMIWTELNWIELELIVWDLNWTNVN